MEELKVGLLYLALHNQLTKKYGVGGVITRKDFFAKVGRHHQIPKPLRHVVIKEMYEKKLIDVESRDIIRIKGCKLDLNRDAHKLLRGAKCF